INNQEIENIKSELNKVEAYYAQIETQIQQTSTEKIATEKTSYLINYMNAVA
ncbi:TPA: hypothetical protein O8320_002703, partial [Staphylococcus aureus]|nr:hypothetical protein [Staphylococcus aureus]HDL0491376.1 hypothetical protein [Staphylococcus aureus]